MKEHSFTFIELLAAFLFPVFLSSREKARAYTCPDDFDRTPEGRPGSYRMPDFC